MRVFSRLLAVAAVAVVASSFSLATNAAPAQAAASPCHGYVYSFKKVGNIVRMEYWVYCSKKVDRIQLKAFLREGDRWSGMNTVTCRNTNYCSNVEKLRDRPGKQWYAGRAYEGTYPPSSFVQHNGDLFPCNARNGMRCGGSGKQF